MIGCLLALRRLGKFGLVFIDGHADFYQPEAEPNGEVASMDLAIVSGRGPAVLTDIDGLKPLMRDEDIVLFGYRDAAQQREYGSQDIRATAMHSLELERVRSMGIPAAANQAVEILRKNNWKNFGFILMPTCWTMQLCRSGLPFTRRIELGRIERGVKGSDGIGSGCRNKHRYLQSTP